jgi:hypothetical protein
MQIVDVKTDDMNIKQGLLEKGIMRRGGQKRE